VFTSQGDTEQTEHLNCSNSDNHKGSATSNAQEQQFLHSFKHINDECPWEWVKMNESGPTFPPPAQDYPTPMTVQPPQAFGFKQRLPSSLLITF